VKTTHHTSTQPPAAKNAALAFIFAVILLDIIGLTILIPVQAYIVRQYSDDALTVALLTVLYAAAQFFAAPLLGTLSDRLGRRPVLLASVLGSAVGYFLFGIGGSLWVLFLSRLIDGFTGGNLSTASAYIADVTPPQERAKNFALLGAAFGIGFILGPALGGALSQINLAAPAYAAGTLSLLSAIVGFFALPESLPAAKRATAPLRFADINPFVPIVELMRRPMLRTLLIIQCLFTFVVMGYNSATPVLLIERFGIPPMTLAALLIVVGVANVLVQAGLVGRLVAIFGEQRLAIMSLLFQALGMLSIVTVPAFWMLFPISAVTSGGAGPLRPSLSALLANQLAAEEQGKLNGVSTALSSLMTVFGPLWAGATYDYVAPSAPFLVGAIVLVLASAMLARVRAAPAHLSHTEAYR
jgi:MFS transporter, DHA1 family, tetracycline resistance protein